MKQMSSTEFLEFVREVGVRSFDELASRTRTTRRHPGISQLAATWREMDQREKEEFFDRLIRAAQGSPPGKRPTRSRAKQT